MSETKLNVYQRLHLVMSEVGTVAKNGRNAHFKYDYATEADFVQAIRPLLVKHGLVVFPSNVTQHVREGDITSIVISYKIVNIEDGNDFILVSIPGAGQDKGDKGVYKAITGAKKYMLANTFMVATGDDPEKEDKKAEPSLKTPKSKKEAFTPNTNFQF